MHTISLMKAEEQRPTIDLGEMLFCGDTYQEGFESTNVNAIEVKEDKEESHNYSEGLFYGQNA